jgi:hypothetical protein
LIAVLLDDAELPRALDGLSNAKTADNWPAIGAIGAAGSYGAEKLFKDTIDKTLKFPATSLKDMYDIASQDTDEGQADKAIDVLWDLAGIKYAPPGSPGGDIKEAGERFKDFYKGKTDIP